MSQIDIATFNVNSVKARLPILNIWLGTTLPDILCLQETKCRDEDFPAAFFEEKGYHCVFKGMKSYNGVALMSKVAPDEFKFGLGDKCEDDRAESESARVVWARFGALTVLNTYIPQGKAIDNPDYPYKLRFIARVRELLERECSPDDMVVWVGDLNVAPTDIDVTNPRNKRDHVCFHQSVKNALAAAMEWGMVDIFREHLPSAGEYTFWDYRVKNALTRNIGWRIDHILGTKSVAAACTDVHVERSLRAMERPSDHTAVVASFML